MQPPVRSVNWLDLARIDDGPPLFRPVKRANQRAAAPASASTKRGNTPCGAGSAVPGTSAPAERGEAPRLRRHRELVEHASPSRRGMKGCTSDRRDGGSSRPAHRAPCPCAPGRSCAAPTAPARRHSGWRRATTSQIALERAMEGLLVDDSARTSPSRPCARVEQRLVVGRRSAPGAGTLAAAVLVDHRQHALRQIAEIVGEVAVEPADHGAVREIAVVAERHLAQQEVAHRVEPVGVDQLERLDHVAERLRDLLAFVGPPAMGEDALRRREAGGHQEGRPVDAWKRRMSLPTMCRSAGQKRLNSRRFRYRDSRAR